MTIQHLSLGVYMWVLSPKSIHLSVFLKKKISQLPTSTPGDAKLSNPGLATAPKDDTAQEALPSRGDAAGDAGASGEPLCGASRERRRCRSRLSVMACTCWLADGHLFWELVDFFQHCPQEKKPGFELNISHMSEVLSKVAESRVRGAPEICSGLRATGHWLRGSRIWFASSSSVTIPSAAPKSGGDQDFTRGQQKIGTFHLV